MKLFNAFAFFLAFSFHAAAQTAGFTPLIKAAAQKTVDEYAIGTLIQNGANVNSRDEQGRSVLMLAAMHNPRLCSSPCVIIQIPTLSLLCLTTAPIRTLKIFFIKPRMIISTATRKSKDRKRNSCSKTTIPAKSRPMMKRRGKTRSEPIRLWRPFP